MILPLLGAFPVTTAPSVVRLVQSDAGYQLLRNGKPYFIRGAGAQEQLQDLATAGGNSIRTWGVGEGTPALMDRCAKHGLTVTVGFWLMKAGDQGFSYRDSERVKKQFDEVRAGVRKLKGHPGLLLWAIGNEVELGLPPDQETAMWTHIDQLAQMIHREDPGRPVMTVVADMWPEKMEAILKYCPNLDLLGVNSYGGLPTLDQRMERWKRPYVITEFQHGFSADGKDQPLGLAVEPSSTEKARVCATMYEQGVANFPGRVLGSYVFYWDRSTTQVASFHGMHIKTGERLQAADEMQFLWTGRAPKNRCPEIIGGFAARSDGLSWRVIARDPDRDRLTYELQIVNEDKPRFEGDFERDLGIAYRAEVKPYFVLPTNLEPGRYRAFVVIRDGKGGSAVWNTVYRVGPKPVDGKGIRSRSKVAIP